MKKKIVLSLMGLVVFMTAWAQLPTAGKYYRIRNINSGAVMTENWREQTVSCQTQDDSEFSQYWHYLSGKLINAYTRNGLQDQPTTSGIYTTGSTSTAPKPIFTQTSDGHITIKTHDTQARYLHCDAGNNVVQWWDANVEKSHWIMEEVTLSQEDLKAAVNEYRALKELEDNASTYGEKLATFFTNELCTELKAEYATMTDDALKAAMAEVELPAMLQEIAVKIKNQWWTNTDNSDYADKNKYAKDFRVASYKPYSDANNWRDKMNTYSPSFMGNPTGIYATKSKEIIHVFVGSDIPEGATLYLTPVRNHGRIGARDEGTELKKGYNVVVGARDSLIYFVNYVVNTIRTSEVNAKTKTIAKISDFPSLDIHIEGGECIGYYQKPAQDSQEETAKFQYLAKNAKDNMYFVVKGDATLFYFKKNTYLEVWRNPANQNEVGKRAETIWYSIDWFDRLRFWEWSLVGVMDDVANGLLENGTEYSKSAHPMNITGGDAFYPTYCNNPSMALEGPSGQNPHATTFYTSYPGTGSVESSFNANRANFDNWCAGHEHGHQMQGPYNLESCSESSVNLPSNVITYLSGFRLGRGWNFKQNYDYVAQQVPFPARDISITMRMYYNLFLYYHTVGMKKDFYPTFVKSLREDPMDFTSDGVQYEHPEWGAPSGGHHRAVNTWIKFYKKACDAAKEDLTEYFRLWGFFVPCDKAYFGDYTSYAVSLTQEEINAAIAEVKAKGYPENLQIMFVEDRQIPRERTDIWAKDATGNMKFKPTNWEEWWDEAQLKAEYGDVGDVLTYIDGSGNNGNYSYVLSGTKLTLTGQGGVGFIVYDKNGVNSYMSNKFEFEIPAQLAKDGFVIKVINADGTSAEVKSASETATDEEKLQILQAAIETSKAYTALEDPEDVKIGYYSTEDLATLKGLVADANAAISAGNVNVYMSLAESINAEILSLQVEQRDNRIMPTALYLINCVRKVNDATRYLTVNSTSKEIVTGTTKLVLSQWAFVPTEKDNEYYLQTLGDLSMLGATLNEKGGVTGVKNSIAHPDEGIVVCKIEALGGGKYGIRPRDNTYLNMHDQGYITIWHDADEGSQWEISKLRDFEDISEEVLDEMIAETETLLKQITVSYESDNVVMKDEFSALLSNTKTLVRYLNEAYDYCDWSFKTSLGLYRSWYYLNSYYTRVHDKAVEIDPTVGISDIQADGENGADIYDLSGRKLKNVTGNGIFIIGGKKVIK